MMRSKYSALIRSPCGLSPSARFPLWPDGLQRVELAWARLRVKTFSYSYLALYPNPLSRNLVRYCSPHEHRKIHHKHVYDVDGIGFSVVEVSDRIWPHVDEFIDEMLEKF